MLLRFPANGQDVSARPRSSRSKLQRCGIQAAPFSTFDDRRTELPAALEKTPEAGLVENQQGGVTYRDRLCPACLVAEQGELSEHLAAAQPEFLPRRFKFDGARGYETDFAGRVALAHQDIAGLDVPRAQRLCELLAAVLVHFREKRKLADKLCLLDSKVQWWSRFHFPAFYCQLLLEGCMKLLSNEPVDEQNIILAFLKAKRGAPQVSPLDLLCVPRVLKPETFQRGLCFVFAPLHQFMQQIGDAAPMNATDLGVDVRV